MIKFNKKIWLLCLTVFCSASILVTVFLAFKYIRSFSASNGTVYVSAKNNINYRVHYKENDFFPSGVRPVGLNYLISFTDYIEIENSFTADFSRSVDASYQYSATETLLIKHQKGSDRNNNLIVHREKNILSEANGSAAGEQIVFNAADAEHSGAFIIIPKEYIDIYRQFVNAQRAQMQKENAVTEKTLNFSAELLVDFTYDIQIAGSGVTQSLTRGVCIPLSNEVFSFEETGAPMAETQILLREMRQPGIFISVLTVLWFCANIFGVCYGIRQLTAKKDVYEHKLKRILGRYPDEIVIVENPADLTKFTVEPVKQFEELLKLAVNFNRHIRCYHNNERAEFCIFADGFAYCYKLYLEDKTGRDKTAPDEAE